MFRFTVAVTIAIFQFICCYDNPIDSTTDNPRETMKFPAATNTANDISNVAVAEEDTVYVDLTGTRIRLVNSSGGSLIASNKSLIVVPDWNILAWPKSHPKGMVDVTSLDRRQYVRTNWQMDMHCEDEDGQSSVHRYDLDRIRFDGVPFVAEADPSTDRTSPCEGRVRYLSFHDRGSVWHRGDGTTFTRGGMMKFKNETIPLHDTKAFKAPELYITYHPVSENSANVARETAWLEGVTESRWGYSPEISRMLPVLSYTLAPLGAPLIVPPDPDAESMIEKVLYALDDVVPSSPVAVTDGVLRLNVAIVSWRVKRVYSDGWQRNDPAGGIAFQGETLTAAYHEPATFNEEGPRALIHELGHNLNLIHTHENPEYPRYPSPDINLDGYRVNRNGEVHLVDRNVYADFMSYFDPPWVSEYSWNKIVGFIKGEHLGLAGRALVAGGRDGRQLITWSEHSH